MALVWLPASFDVLGAWVPEHRVIAIRSGLPSATRRSVLAEELAHAELGHEPHPDPMETARMEFRARRAAARNLIAREDLLEAIAASDYLNEVAERLDVDPDLVRIRLLDLQP